MGDFSYLDEGVAELQTSEVLADIANVGNRLRELKQRMIDTKAAADAAEKEYKHYAEVLVPMQMKAVGLDSIKLASGETLCITHNVYCEPNKNERDRAIIANWLAKYNGGHLVKQEATVAQDSLADLDAAGIDYAVSKNINTNSLKAFIKNLLGLAKGSTKVIDVSDIPECIHFHMVDKVEVRSE